MNYHKVSLAIDVTVTPALRSFLASIRRIDWGIRATRLNGRLFVAGYSPPRRKTSSAYRTRSARWRSGTRRTRKMVRDAKRRGRRSPTAGPFPFKGWTPMGWIDEPGDA